MGEVVACRTVKRIDNGREYPCQVVVLDQGDLYSLLELQELVVKQMPEKSYYFPLTMAEMKELLGEKGLTVGVLVENKLQAFSSIFYPGMSAENLGRDVGLTAEQLLLVAQMETIIVNPLFRGNSLQRLTANVLQERTFKDGRFRFLLTMISPENTVSIGNTLSQNIYIIKLVKKKLLWRYILYQDRLVPLQINAREVIAVNNKDMERQLLLLQENYVGVRQVISTAGTEIVFMRCIINTIEQKIGGKYNKSTKY